LNIEHCYICGYFPEDGSCWNYIAKAYCDCNKLATPFLSRYNVSMMLREAVQTKRRLATSAQPAGSNIRMRVEGLRSHLRLNSEVLNDMITESDAIQWKRVRVLRAE